MTAQLKREEFRVNHKCVLRLMRESDLLCRTKRRFVRTTDSDHPYPVYPNVYEDTIITGVDQVRVADITYIRLLHEFVYPAVILDAYSRRVVGWALASHLRAELVLDALEMAIQQRHPDGVIHHSDHGSQYTSIAFGKRCREAGVRPSMGTVGDCYDNAMCESFFATLECELLDRQTFSNRAEARLAVFEFIEGWYNPHRRHSSIGYESPINFERKHTAQVTLSSETEKRREAIAIGEGGGERT